MLMAVTIVSSVSAAVAGACTSAVRTDWRPARAVTAVAQDLARLRKQWSELDGRWAGQVIVRGGDA